MRVTTLPNDVSRPKPAKLKHSSVKDTCTVCRGSHVMHKCPVFLAKSTILQVLMHFAIIVHASLLLLYKGSAHKGKIALCRTVFTHQITIHYYTWLRAKLMKKKEIVVRVHLVLLKVVHRRRHFWEWSCPEYLWVVRHSCCQFDDKLPHRCESKATSAWKSQSEHCYPYESRLWAIAGEIPHHLYKWRGPFNHALEIEDSNVSNRYCPSQVDLFEWPHLKDVELLNHPVDASEVSVLIGQDVPPAHIILYLGQWSTEQAVCD